MLTEILLTLLLLLIFTIYKLITRKYNYWDGKDLVHVKPSLLFGNFKDYILLKKTNAEIESELCKLYPAEPYIGAYYGTDPVLIIQCPEVIKNIFTKDFPNYNGREVSDYTNKEVITQNMFFTYGDRWRIMRQNFTPLFSSAKMKNMFYLIEKCYHDLEKLVDEEVKVNKVIKVRSLFSRYTIDCITSCVFGVDAGAMGKHSENNPFKEVGEKSLAVTFKQGFSLVVRAMWPAIFYGMGFRLFSEELNKFFHNLTSSVFKARDYKPSGRNDFVDLILEFTKKKYIEGDSMTEKGKKTSLVVNDVLLEGQAWSFFVAGYETSASTLTYTLYELAKNIEAQDRAADEVKSYLKKNKSISYSCVTDLPYTYACVEEALRLYPVLLILTREVFTENTLAFDKEELSERWNFPKSPLKLTKNLRLHFPILHLHRDPENFPEPMRYLPERFLPENRQNIKPYTYLPFGEGPRVCIGMRFAKMQILPALVAVLSRYRLELAPNTPLQLELDPRAIVATPRSRIDLIFTPRE